MSGFHKSLFSVIFASSSSCSSNSEAPLDFRPWPSALFFPFFFPLVNSYGNDLLTCTNLPLALIIHFGTPDDWKTKSDLSKGLLS